MLIYKAIINHNSPTPQKCMQFAIQSPATFFCMPEPDFTGIGVDCFSVIVGLLDWRVSKNLCLMIWMTDSSPPLCPLRASISSLALQLITVKPFGKQVSTTVFVMVGTFCTICEATFPTMPGTNSSIFIPIKDKNGMRFLAAFSFIDGRRDLTSRSSKGYQIQNYFLDLDCNLLEDDGSFICLGIIATSPLSLMEMSMKTDSSWAVLSQAKLELLYLWNTAQSASMRMDLLTVPFQVRTQQQFASIYAARESMSTQNLVLSFLEIFTVIPVWLSRQKMEYSYWEEVSVSNLPYQRGFCSLSMIVTLTGFFQSQFRSIMVDQRRRVLD